MREELRDTKIQGANEIESLKNRIENENRNTYDIQNGGQLLFDENTKLKEEVKHTERYWNTIISKDEEI